MTLYIDSLFIVNFIMNYIILFFTGKLTNQRFRTVVTTGNYLLGSLVTTIIYLMFILIKVLRDNFNFFYAILIISIGVLLTFRPKKLKKFFTYLIFTHVVAFTVGGASYGIFYYTEAGAFLGNTVEATLNNLSIKLLISATTFSYIIIKFVVNFIEKTKISKQHILNTKITKESRIDLQMLVDTGNTLVEPISKLPVVVIYYKTLENLLDSRLFELYEKQIDVMTEAFNIDDELSLNLKIIPFKSVGCASGIILGIECTIEFTFENLDYKKNCIVGIVDFEIAKNKEYSGIFNPMLIEEDVINVKKVII